jgi:hypothetical protein
VDGGEVTRLMTVGVDGESLRCLAKGFLSHFDWLSDETIFIWGQDERRLCRLREAQWLSLPGLLQAALLSKRLMRSCRALRGANVRHDSPSQINQTKSFMRIADVNNPVIERIGIGILTEDGHPMTNPKLEGLIVNDTYPHADKTRTLMLFDTKTNRRTDLGTFRMLDSVPNESMFDVEGAFSGIDPRIRKKFPRAQYLFTRSGLHCDLHPRWNAQGTQVAFDSAHDGSRQIYTVDCSGVLNE